MINFKVKDANATYSIHPIDCTVIVDDPTQLVTLHTSSGEKFINIVEPSAEEFISKKMKAYKELK
jgi:hypothetical protein